MSQGVKGKSNPAFKSKVHELHVHHPKIRGEDFRSPLVRRISGKQKYMDGNGQIKCSYKPANQSIDENELHLEWEGLDEDFKKCLNTYQDPVITELATIGLACILLKVHSEREITEVTRRGEKADYWLGDREEMLEVSGQQDGNIGDLCETKSGQLLENPFDKPGFVCVAVYNELVSRLWYYENSGGTK